MTIIETIIGLAALLAAWAYIDSPDLVEVWRNLQFRVALARYEWRRK